MCVNTMLRGKVIRDQLLLHINLKGTFRKTSSVQKKNVEAQLRNLKRRLDEAQPLVLPEPEQSGRSDCHLNKDLVVNDVN